MQHQQVKKDKPLNKKLQQKLAKSQVIDFELSPQQVEELIAKHPNFFNGLSTFEFNIFELTEAVGRNMQMPFVATALMELNGLTQKYNKEKFLEFIVQIYNGYNRSVDYHNDLHGSDVAQHVHFMIGAQNLSKLAQFNDLDTMSLLVAALCHDVGHDGFTNRYHVVTQSDRYQMYGQEHIQESYHAAETLKLMQEFDFLSGHFSGQETQLFKKRIINTIIHTDMAEMKNLRNQLTHHLDCFSIEDGKNVDCLIDPTSPKSIEDSKQLVANSIIHACDISTSLREFDLST